MIIPSSPNNTSLESMLQTASSTTYSGPIYIRPGEPGARKLRSKHKAERKHKKQGRR